MTITCGLKKVLSLPRGGSSTGGLHDDDLTFGPGAEEIIQADNAIGDTQRRTDNPPLTIGVRRQGHKASAGRIDLPAYGDFLHHVYFELAACKWL